MPLFQNSVLKNYLTQQDGIAVEKAYKKYSRYFLNPEVQENFRSGKEEQFQATFLTQLFVNVLDYTINPSPKYNLTTEYKNEKNNRKADGAILYDNIVFAVVELKGTNTKDLESIRRQAFDYKVNHKGCRYVITSNFEKLRFYVDDATEYESFDLFNLTFERFALLFLCLNKSNLLNNIPLRIKQDSLVKEELITKEFYNDYSLFKRELFRDLVKRNVKKIKKVRENELKELDLVTPFQNEIQSLTKNVKLSLFKKSQKLIDRFLFIFFAEDRGLLTPNSTLEILEKWKSDVDFGDDRPLYNLFKQYFGYLDTGRQGTKSRAEIYAYNGGLFQPDSILDNLEIDDNLLYRHCSKLANYNFESQVDVNILGHIFENSLNEIESVNAEIEGDKFDKQKSKRKKDGVFYTPKYITKYIVENTLGKLCEEKKRELGFKEEEYYKGRKNRKGFFIQRLVDTIDLYRNWLLQITICDPACGSGAFLNQALDFLIKEHQYLDELKAKVLGGGFQFPDIENTILENNIYGVDLNEESVEIAKLSLWLRTAQPRRKLNDLSSNIKCGNSLIESKAIAGNKAFNWNDEFPKVFANGGFDIIIGNPPYVDIKALDNNLTKHLFVKYKTSNNRINLYSTFIERSTSILRKKGYLSFIIPSSLLTQDSYKKLRELLLNNTTIENIVRLPNESFGGGAGEVKVDTIILTFGNDRYKSETEVIVYKGFDRISEIADYNADIHFFTDSQRWKDDSEKIFRINVDDDTIRILDKCNVNVAKLIDCADFSLGLTPYDKYKGHTQEQIKNRVFHSEFKKDESFKKLLAGNDISRYSVVWGGKEWISYGEWLGASREQRFFIDKRILVKQIIDWSDKRIWAALTEKELYNTQNAFNLLTNDNYKPEYILGIINSKLMSFYHKKQFLEEYKDRFQKILIKDAKEFPIKLLSLENQEKFVSPVNSMIEAISQKRDLTEKFVNYLIAKFSLEKVSRKIEYWYIYDFGDFIKEMKKAISTTNKIRAKEGKPTIPKIKTKDEFEWMDFFEQKKNSVQEILSEINRVDQQLDTMVYKLYGLTEKEIIIVENSYE